MHRWWHNPEGYGDYRIWTKSYNSDVGVCLQYVTTILDDVKIYASHAKKATVDADDVPLAIQCRADRSFTSPTPRDFLLDIERQRNQTPLPLIKPYSGPRLPPGRYCMTAPNYRLKSFQKKQLLLQEVPHSSVLVQLPVDQVLPHLAHQPHKPCWFQLK